MDGKGGEGPPEGQEARQEVFENRPPAHWTAPQHPATNYPRTYEKEVKLAAAYIRR